MAQALRHCRSELPAARLGDKNGEVCETMRHAKRSAEKDFLDAIIAVPVIS